MSAERVLSEIHSVEALTPTRILKFHDDNFAVNEKRLHAILDQLSSNYTLYIEMRTNRITREFLESIKRFKRVWFFFGIESGSQRLLDEMAKGIKLDDHRKAMALIDQYPNFCTSGNAIVGLPGETQEEFEQTVDFTFDLKMTWGNISLFCPYPGSEYYEDVLSEGRIKVPTQLEEWADWGFYFNEQIASWFEWDYIGQKGRNYLKQLDRKNFRLAFLRMVKKGEFHKMGRRLLDYKPMLHATLQKIERRVFSA